MSSASTTSPSLVIKGAQKEIDVLLHRYYERQSQGHIPIELGEAATKASRYTYGNAFKYVNGKAVALSPRESSSRRRLRNSKMCWLEFPSALVLYSIREVMSVFDLTRFVLKPTPKAVTTPTTVRPSLYYTPETHIVHEREIKDSRAHMEDVDIKKLIHFGVAIWIGFTISLAILTMLGVAVL